MRPRLALATRVSAFACALALGLPTAAMAQQAGGNIDLNTFRPAMDSRGYITVNASETLDHLDVSFGLITNWAHSVLRFEEGDAEYEVTNMFAPTLVAAFGLDFKVVGLELGVSAPFSIMAGDRGPDYFGMSGPGDDNNFKFEGQGFGDLGLHLKARLLSTSQGPGIGLAVIGSVYLPTASEENKWLGEGSATPQVMAVVDTELGSPGQFRAGITAGVRLRSGDHAFVDTPMGTAIDGLPQTDQRIAAGNTLPFGAAIAYGVVPEKFEVIGEVFGALPLGDDSENFQPLEGLVGLKLYLAKNSFLTFGGGVGFLGDTGGNPDYRAFLGIVFEPNVGDRDGDGIKDDVDQCPDEAEDRDGFEDEDGCPDPDNDQDGILDVDDDCPNDPEDMDGIEDEDGCPEGEKHDRDGDGILDEVDQCPDEPEDIDGFEDEDGCPDPDNDQDGILDVDDLCPDDPEDFDQFRDSDGCPEPDNDEDRITDLDDECPQVDGETREETAEVWNEVDNEDGCPDRGLVTITDTKIEKLKKIYFEYDSDVIQPKSYPILDAIVAALKSSPDIQLIEIQGHTDERGSDAYNLDLSDRRAKAVRRYLIEHGLDPERLVAQGYGESMPVIRASTRKAYAANRRVEFLILKRANQL